MNCFILCDNNGDILQIEEAYEKGRLTDDDIGVISERIKNIMIHQTGGTK